MKKKTSAADAMLKRMLDQARPLGDDPRRPWGAPDAYGYVPVNEARYRPDEAAAANAEISGPVSRHPDLTLKRVLLLFEDLIPDFANANNTKKGEFVALLTGFSAEKARQELTYLSNRKKKATRHSQEDQRIVDVWKEKLKG